MKISTVGQSRSHSLKDLLLSSVCASVLALSCVPGIARADENVVNAIGTTINVTGGDISTTGDGDPTVTADHQGTVTLSDVTITTQGHSSHGLYANDGSTISITDSAITTEGYNGRGVYAIGGSSITLTDTNIWTFGGAAAGIFAVGSGTDVDATNVNISTTGSSGNGVFAFEDAVVTIDGGKLNVAGDGVPDSFIEVVGLRASFGGQISAEDLEINMAGQNVIGLAASGVSPKQVSPFVTMTGGSGTLTGMNSTGGKVADGGSITLDHYKLTVENGVGFVMIDDASATLFNSTVTSSARTFDATFFESGMSQEIMVDGESRIINTEDLTLLEVSRQNDGSDGEVKLTIRGGSSVEGNIFDEDFRDGNGNTTVVIENASLTGMMQGVQNLELSKAGVWNATFDSTVDQISLGEGGGTIGATVFDVTLAAPISGRGGLITTGDKLLTLTGNSSFEGGIIIESGTLSFGNGGTCGAYGGNIVNNATLIIDRSNSIIYNGEISGSGNSIKKGLGTLTWSCPQKTGHAQV